MSSEKAKLNLDRLAAERAQSIINNTKANHSAEDVDNLVTKALGVLQEDGVYACGLFLLSRSQDKERKIAAVVTKEMLNLLSGLPFGWERHAPKDVRNTDQVLKYLSGTVAGDPELERLLLAKDTLERMMIYARYGAKAWKQESKAQSNKGE